MTQDNETQVQAFVADAERMLLPYTDGVRIATADDYEEAGAVLQQIKRRSKDLDDLRRGMTKPLDEAKRRIMDLFARPVQLLTDAESAIKRGLLGYQREQERIRAEEEARLREQARKEAAKLLARSERASAAGKGEMAEALEEQALAVPVPIVVSETPNVSGVSTRQIWHAEIVDWKALIQAVAAGHVPEVVLLPNLTVLNAQARALKGALDYPGVKAVAEQIVAAGGSRDLAPPRPRT